MLSVLANNLKDPYRSIIIYVNPILTMLAYRYHREILDWIVEEVRAIKTRFDAASACKGLKKYIAEQKERLKDPDLDEDNRQEIQKAMAEAQKSLTKQQFTANVDSSVLGDR